MCADTKKPFSRTMRFLTLMWDILMTFFSSVSVLASSIGWLMSQLANIMFFLLQLLIISMTFCPSEPLLKLCTTEQSTHTNPACFLASVEGANMDGIILYRTHPVRDVYDAPFCLFLRSLKAIKSMQAVSHLLAFNKTACSSGRQLFKTVGSHSRNTRVCGVTKAPSASRKKRLFFYLKLFEETVSFPH